MRYGNSLLHIKSYIYVCLSCNCVQQCVKLCTFFSDYITIDQFYLQVNLYSKYKVLNSENIQEIATLVLSFLYNIKVKFFRLLNFSNLLCIFREE